MPVELRDLKWAIIAAQHRSLRRAADALNVRESTLCRRLRQLEYQLDAKLFERTNGGTRPTVPGQEFLESARRILDDTEAITTRFKTRSRGEHGRLTIGVHASLTAGNLKATLVDHRHRFPDVETYIVDGSSEHLLSDLASSAIDVAFVADGNSQWTDKMLPVWSERVVVAIPADHPLSAHEVVQWHELRKERLLVPQRGPGPEFMKLLALKIGNPQSYRVIRHDTGLDRLLTLVGVGWGLLLALEGATGATFPGVTFREVYDDDGPSRVGFCTCWKRSNDNPSLQAFLTLLRERYPDLSWVGGAN
ncbi:LysR family transcriptional regulator [Rhodopila sp.]|uniref:LysR substrate-binding domain-containing protein n=1 Tax=Rhodopila sp. TaxID=2480087 RepID=UPI002C85CD30|nr:LysR family transcriptional regulator [Rhodopila sp.]HVZ06629.1 LysR family transcriptional regulator [Rhodopila sp.]